MQVMRILRVLKNSGLTIALILLFMISIVGHFEAGFRSYNEDRIEKKLPPLENRNAYFKSGHFISSVSENMESEFLQMGLFVLLTMFLYQKGSAESKKPKEEMTKNDNEEERKEEAYCRSQRRRHPVLWRLYENSLTIALFLFFIVSFFLHAYGSKDLINEQKRILNETPISYWQVFSESEFWFESFQNWQSEFFSMAMIILLTIFLRQKGSAQSKKMFDPQDKTGDD